MIKKDRVRRPRRKICQGCVDHIENVDYKDIAMLRRFISERGKILPRRVTRNMRETSAQDQSRNQEGKSYCIASVQRRLIEYEGTAGSKWYGGSSFFMV